MTGGIGSGKSTVSEYIREKGIKTIDADEISRNLTKKDGAALPAIRKFFGEQVFFEDGTLNRKALGNIVFSDRDKLKLLESCTTEVVDRIIRKELAELKENDFNGVVVLDIPLLFEGGDQVLCDETWVVTCSYDIKVERLLKRDNTTLEAVKNRMANQMSDEDKIKLATYIIDNSFSLDYLYTQIELLLLKNNCI
ncbi:MAG: dephospho-CoA kinase [Clostridia bacterium]|nr:dephospho-CoA kinase [Clostridia bacterium]